MLTPQQKNLLDRLLRIVNPNAAARRLIASLRAKAAPRGPGGRFLPIVPRPPPPIRPITEAEYLRRIAPAYLSILGAPGLPELEFHYARIIEVVPRKGLGRNSPTLENGGIGGGRLGRYTTIRVDSPLSLTRETNTGNLATDYAYPGNLAVEEAFRLALRDFRRLVNYTGPIRYVSPMQIGVAPPLYYFPPMSFYPSDYFD
jgi:hypothetical protein